MKGDSCAPFVKSSIIDHHSSIPWSYYHLPELTRSGIVHGFMTKSSDSIVNDELQRSRFAGALGTSAMILMQQEHGDKVHVVEKGERPATGDGILLLERGVVGVIKTADCLPVILADLDHRMVAIVHAGWRGTVQKISGKALRQMVAMGGRRERIAAVIGPGIGPCCYDVGEDVATRFQEAGFGEMVLAGRGGRTFLDLKEANREVIEAEGIGMVNDIGLCTSCRRDLFFSARRDGLAGRQVNFIQLKE